MNISWLKRKLFIWIVKSVYNDSVFDRKDIIWLYRVIYQLARVKFCEDTNPTIRNVLKECNEEAFGSSYPYSLTQVRLGERNNINES